MERDDNTAFNKWLAAVTVANVVGLEELAQLCADDGVRKALYDRACNIATQSDDGVVSTIDTINRTRDAERVAEKLGLPER